MRAAVNTAAAIGSYDLSDRARWRAFGNRAGLRIAFDGDTALGNPYACLSTRPAIRI